MSNLMNLIMMMFRVLIFFILPCVTTLGLAHANNVASLPAITTLILNDSDELAPTKQILFADSLTSSADWFFNTSGVSTSDEEFDSATSEISKGVLNVFSSQDYGCPSASASTSFDQEEGLTNFTLEIEIPSTFITDGGSGSVRLAYNDTLIRLSLKDLSNQESGFDIRDGVIRVNYRDGEVKAKLDQTDISSTKLSIETVEPNEQANIAFFTQACGSDGFHNGDISVDAIELFTFILPTDS